GSMSMEYFRKAVDRSHWEPAISRIRRLAVPEKELAETTIRSSGRSMKYACTIALLRPPKFGRSTRSRRNNCSRPDPGKSPFLVDDQSGAAAETSGGVAFEFSPFAGM